MGNVVYKVVYWGDPDYRVGSDGSFWSRKKTGPGKATGPWKRRTPSALSKSDNRPALCFVVGGKRRNIQLCHIVLRTFVGPPPPGCEACHFPDRDPWNNTLTNLRWDTRRENFRDRDTHGTTARGSAHGMAKLTEEQVLEIRRLYKPGKESKFNTVRLARIFGVDHTMISMIVTRKNWRHI